MFEYIVSVYREQSKGRFRLKTMSTILSTENFIYVAQKE